MSNNRESEKHRMLVPTECSFWITSMLHFLWIYWDKVDDVAIWKRFMFNGPFCEPLKMMGKFGIFVVSRNKVLIKQMNREMYFRRPGPIDAAVSNGINVS